MMRAADKAWLALAAGIIAYEASAPEGELLSHGVDRYLQQRPWLTRAVVCVTAAHLINVLPQWCDPYSHCDISARSMDRKMRWQSPFGRSLFRASSACP